MKVRLLNDITKELEDSLRSIRDPIAEAATGAVRDAGDELKTAGRANIAAAGFSSKWQNTWRVEFFPKKGVSIDAAAWGFHRIPYSIVFEEGATIAGKSGLLWIPLSGANLPNIGRGKATPRKLAQSGVKLVSMHAKAGLPLLGAEVRVSKAQASLENLSVSLAKLRKGTAGKTGTVRVIPLFFGVKSVSIRKKFDIAGVAERARESLPGRYVENLRV